MILNIDRQGDATLYNQIVAQIRTQIVDGSLCEGTRLPPSRVLARELGVHRTTVNNAYAKLESEGVIHSHVGRGTFVAAVPLEPESTKARGTEPTAQPPIFWDTLLNRQQNPSRLHRLLQPGAVPGCISFAHALPAADLFPVDDFKRCAGRVLRRDVQDLMQIGDSLGYWPLREHLVPRLAARGIRATAEDILITNGCQQSLDLVGRVFLKRGDTILIEEPTFPGIHNLFAGHDIKCVSIPMRENGMDLDLLEEVLAHHTVKLIYTIATFHSPTGATLDLEGRRRLLAMAVKHRVPIVEDDIYADLRYEGQPLPPVKALDDQGVVIYLNSFSKVGFPGMRVGWIVAPPPVLERLSQAKQNCDLHTNLLAQAIMCEFSKNGAMLKYLKRERAAYARRRDVMLAVLEQGLPPGSSWNRPQGGLSIWVTLPEPMDSANLLPGAAQNGVLFSPGELFYLNNPQSNTMRLTFAMDDIGRIREGLERLLKVIAKTYRSLDRTCGSNSQAHQPILV